MVDDENCCIFFKVFAIVLGYVLSQTFSHFEAFAQYAHIALGFGFLKNA